MLPALRRSARPCPRVVFRSTRGRPRGSHPPLSRTSAHALGPRGRVPEPAPRRPHGGNGRGQHGATTGPLRPGPSPRDRPCPPVTARARARPQRRRDGTGRDGTGRSARDRARPCEAPAAPVAHALGGAGWRSIAPPSGGGFGRLWRAPAGRSGPLPTSVKLQCCARRHRPRGGFYHRGINPRALAPSLCWNASSILAAPWHEPPRGR